jgi:hypothetical protein
MFQSNEFRVESAVSAIAGMCHSNLNGVEYNLSILLWVLKHSALFIYQASVLYNMLAIYVCHIHRKKDL